MSTEKRATMLSSADVLTLGLFMAGLQAINGYVCPIVHITGTLLDDCHGSYDVIPGSECNGRPVFKQRNHTRYISASATHWGCQAAVTCNSPYLVTGPKVKTNHPLGNWGVKPNKGKANCESPITLSAWSSFLNMENMKYYMVDNKTDTCMTVNATDFEKKTSAILVYNIDSTPPTNVTKAIFRMAGPTLPCHVKKQCDPMTTVIATDRGNGTGKTLSGKCSPFCGMADQCAEKAIPIGNGNTDCEYTCTCYENKCKPILFILYNQTFTYTPQLEICEITAMFSTV